VANPLPLADGELLHGRTIALRNQGVADAEPIFAVWGSEAVMRFVPSDPFGSLEDVRSALENGVVQGTSTGRYRFAIVRRGDGELVGTCGIYSNRAFEETWEVAYHLAPAHWGHGYGTEAAALLLRYGFERLGASKLIALVYPGNLASLRVAEKVGMERLGPRSGYVEDEELVLFEKAAPTGPPGPD